MQILSLVCSSKVNSGQHLSVQHLNPTRLLRLCLLPLLVNTPIILNGISREDILEDSRLASRINIQVCQRPVRIRNQIKNNLRIRGKATRIPAPPKTDCSEPYVDIHIYLDDHQLVFETCDY